MVASQSLNRKKPKINIKSDIKIYVKKINNLNLQHKININLIFSNIK